MGVGTRGKSVQQQGTAAGGAMPPLRNRQCLSALLLLTIIMSFLVSHRLLTAYLADPEDVGVKRTLVSEELLLNLSAVNGDYGDADREKLRDLLDRSENGTRSIREVLFLRRRPEPAMGAGMDRDLRIAISRRRQRQNSWMVPISSRRYEPFVPTFYRLAENWLAQGLFDPRVMQELPSTVKEPLDRQSKRLSLNDTRDVTAEEGSPSVQRRYRSCAVVGNSGILLNSSYGEQIDSHEMVIRLNNARIEGFEKHVGKKTSLAFVNSNIFRICARREGCACHPYGPHVPIMLYMCQGAHLMDVALCRSYHSSPLIVTDGRLDILCARLVKWYSIKNFLETSKQPIDRWGPTHGGIYFHYSSGFQALVVALGICDRVSMFGFGKDPLLKHHYHTQQKEELDLHDYQAEYNFYNDLVNRRSIPFLSEAGISIPPVQIFR